MKAIGLTNTQFLIAVVIGIGITIAWVAATAPHPASVPVQVIAPVPTPPPVVITQQQPSGNQINQNMVNPDTVVVLMTDTIMSTMLPLITMVMIIMFISLILRGIQ